MITTNDKTPSRLASAVEAANKLTIRGLNEIAFRGKVKALGVHSAIAEKPVERKRVIFYANFEPLRGAMVSVLAESYRLYFRLAVIHEIQIGKKPEQWARIQIGSAIDAALEWLRDWFVLACDGETKCDPVGLPETWRAPAWLFEVSIVTVGIEKLKPQNVPVRDTDEKLNVAYTRLLFKGAKRVFLRELVAAIETVRNEVLAAGDIPTQAAGGEKRRPNKREGWEQRERLYDIIRQILDRNPALEGLEFCAELDKRHAPPLYDWTKHGERWLGWKAAWRNITLLRRIRRVRQEAMRAR